MPGASDSVAARRMRLHRERRKRGLGIVRLEVSFDVAEALIEAGYLPGWDEEDPAAVAAAVERALAAWLDDVTRNAA